MGKKEKSLEAISGEKLNWCNWVQVYVGNSWEIYEKVGRSSVSVLFPWESPELCCMHSLCLTQRKEFWGAGEVLKREIGFSVGFRVLQWDWGVFLEHLRGFQRRFRKLQVISRVFYGVSWRFKGFQGPFWNFQRVLESFMRVQEHLRGIQGVSRGFGA